MAVINKLDQESKEKLKKQEFQVYRRKKLNQPAADQKQNPPLDVIFHKTSKTERVNLNFDLEGALFKICNHPFERSHQGTICQRAI
jgi:hypothetical protein